MSLCLATFTLVADREGFDVRRATLEQAALSWLVFERVAEVNGEVAPGREMARMYLARCRKEHEANALEEQARATVNEAFLARVADLARTVH
jgi:hypothetical protein